MAYFKDLNEIVNKVVELIGKDKKLLELIAYPNVKNKNLNITDLMLKNIFLMPRGADAIKDEKTFLNIYIEKAFPYESNSGFREAYLTFDIFSHLNIWNVEKTNDMRPYLISSKIDEIFNDNFDEQVRQISIKAPYFFSWEAYKYGEYFYGYKLRYCISNDSNVGKRRDG